MPECCVNGTVAVDGSVYALAQRGGGLPGEERAVLVRIDPASNAVTGQRALLSGMSIGDSIDGEPIAVADGSIWVPMYWHDVVLRIDPLTMQIVARVAVGPSPGSIVSDGHSVWVALLNGDAVARIDPGTNIVVATVPVGRGNQDSPFRIAFDGTQVLASLPASGRVARIDPRTSRVHYDAVGRDAASCGRIMPAPGGYWLDDTECSASYYRWDYAAQQITVEVNPQPLNDFGGVVVGDALYTAEFHCGAVACSHGRLVKWDAVTGVMLASRHVGEEAFLVHYAAGSFWVGDWDAGALIRVRHF